MFKLKFFIFFLAIFNFTHCIIRPQDLIKPQYQVIRTFSNGAIVKDYLYSTACKNGICPTRTYYIKKRGRRSMITKSTVDKQKYFIENIEGITFYDGYIFEVPDGYKLEDIGLFKYTPIPTQNSKYFNTDGYTMTIPVKRLVKIENVKK